MKTKAPKTMTETLRQAIRESGLPMLTLATQTGMTNRWLEEQGLVSIQALWVSFHYPAKA